jgi:hypothetical protein
VAREVLGAYADLKMDLGLSNRVGESVDVNVNITTDVSRYGKKSVENVMNDPEKRRKVLNMAERMLAHPGRLEVIDAVATENAKLEGASEAELEKNPDQELIDEAIEQEVLAALEAEELKKYPSGRGPGVDPDSLEDGDEDEEPEDLEAEGYPA